MRCRRARSPKLPTDERVDGHHERHLRRLNSVRRGSSRRSPHITFKRQLICAHTAAGVRKAESEHMVHWGRRCCGAPCSRIVRIRALVQCPVGSKLTSSGGIALQAARSWELKRYGFTCTISTPKLEFIFFLSDRISLQELDLSFSTVVLFLQTDTVVRRMDARKICLVRKS